MVLVKKIELSVKRPSNLVQANPWDNMKRNVPGRVVEEGGVFNIYCFTKLSYVSNFLVFGYSSSLEEVNKAIAMKRKTLGPGEAVFITVPQEGGGRVNIKLSSPPYARRFKL